MGGGRLRRDAGDDGRIINCHKGWTKHPFILYNKRIPQNTMTKTERLIDRIKNVEKFNDIAYLCEDFQSFVDEVQEWGVDHICGVDFFGKGFELNPELDYNLLDEFFSSFGYTKSNPHPAGRYA